MRQQGLGWWGVGRSTLGPDVRVFRLLTLRAFFQNFTFLLGKMGISEAPELDSQARDGFSPAPGSEGTL